MNVFTRRGGPSLVALLLLACGVRSQENVVAGARSDALSAASRTKTITILHVNDSHSTLDAVGPKANPGAESGLVGTLGGLAKAATVIGGIRAAAPERTLFVHAGDVFEGDLTFVPTAGILELSFLKELGLDALTLGNHEFDYGPDVLANSLVEGGYRDGPAVLSANLAKPDGTQPLSSIVMGHAIKDVGGVRVGIFGLTTATDPMMQTAPFTIAGGDSVEAMKAIAMREIRALRAPRQPGGPAEVVILLSHLGARLEHGLAEALPPGLIQFIVAGHDEFEETFGTYDPGTIPVVRAGHFYQWVGKLDITVRNGRVIGATHELIPVDASVEPFGAIADAVHALQQEISASLATALGVPGFDAFRQPVAYATETMPYEWTSDMGPRRDLGIADLAADALEAHFAGAQLGVTTSGFLNDKLYEGPIVANDLFRALPYGINPKVLDPELPDAILPDPVLKVTMTGAQLYAGFEFAIALGQIPQVSDGVFVCYDESASPKIQLIALGNAPVLPDATEYQVATNIFLVGAINQLFSQYAPDLGQIAIPGDFDPMVSQFSVLLEYASGKELSTPAVPRVLNTPDCAAYVQ